MYYYSRPLSTGAPPQYAKWYHTIYYARIFASNASSFVAQEDHDQIFQGILFSAIDLKARSSRGIDRYFEKNHLLLDEKYEVSLKSNQF